MDSKIESGLPEIQERLKSGYLYLKGRGIVHTQQDIANKMGRTKQTVSRAFNGHPLYLTSIFVENFASIFGLNPEWILTGNGDMLADPSQEPQTAAIVNNQVGNGNHFTNGSTVERFLDELAAQRELTREAQQQLTKSQEQMDRLITIIEKLKQ